MFKKIFSFSIVLSIIIFSGCKKDNEVPEGPQIKLKSSGIYTQNNAIIAIGHKLFFGIEATAGDEVITNFTIKKVLENNKVVTMFDTGMYSQNFDLAKIFFQNVEEKATWVFSVMDKNRLSSEVQLVIFKDPNSAFGGIFYYPSIKLGYQNNTEFGHFLDPNTGVVYSDDSTNVHFDKVHILTYYIESESQPSPVLSSAGEMDNYSSEAKTFYPAIINWSQRNYTLWDISVDDNPINIADFNAAQNDSLMIVSYNDVWGKKKFRWANTGRIIPFKTSTGKLGLIRVINAEHSDNGTIEIAVKIQQ